MAENKTYWRAMERFNACLRGEITNEQLEADPDWQWYLNLKAQWENMAKPASRTESIAEVLKRQA